MGEGERGREGFTLFFFRNDIYLVYPYILDGKPIDDFSNKKVVLNKIELGSKLRKCRIAISPTKSRAREGGSYQLNFASRRGNHSETRWPRFILHHSVLPWRGLAYMIGNINPSYA